MNDGLNYLARGFRMLNEPGVRQYAAGPLLINIVLFASLITFASQQFNYWTDYLLGQIPSWLGFLEFILWPLFVLLMLIIVIFSFTMLINIIGAPFNAILAEQVAERCTGQAPPSASETWAGTAASVPRSLIRELARLAYTLPMALGIWIITLIPAINVAAPLLWFLWGAWMMSIQYSDYAADNNRVKFGNMRMVLGRNRALTLSFGAAVTVATLIPIVNLFVMPAAVCGATLLWCERLQSQCDTA
ncbi:MAG: sulfate transporter CysZ [Pseudomonadota bacterium]